jgi:hypothetical protein
LSSRQPHIFGKIITARGGNVTPRVDRKAHGMYGI